MRTCRNILVCSFCAVVLAPVVGGEQQQGIASSTKQAWHTTKQESQKSVDSFNNQQQARSTALDEVDAGPDPFFADVVGRVLIEDEEEQGGDESVVGEVALPRTRLVEVYENEWRGLGRRWRELRPAGGLLSALATPQWSYKVTCFHTLEVP